MCPTGALDYIEKQDSYGKNDNIGFNDFDIAPSINIISLHKENEKPEIVPDLNISSKIIDTKKEESKITLKKEWPLVIFTISMAYLIAEFFALVFWGHKVNQYGFILLCCETLLKKQSFTKFD